MTQPTFRQAASDSSVPAPHAHGAPHSRARARAGAASFSPLRLSAASRLLAVSFAAAALWACVYWALH